MGTLKTLRSSSALTIYTIIKTTSVCDGDARSVGGGRGWLASDTNGLAGWPVTVGRRRSGRGRHTLRCQPARSRRSAVQVRVFTLHTGAGWAW